MCGLLLKGTWICSQEHISPTNKLTCSQLSGFIARLVEHCIGVAEVIGSNPFEATWIFQVSPGYKRQLLKLTRYSAIIISPIHVTSLVCIFSLIPFVSGESASKKQKTESFRQKEKRKRDQGQSSRGKSYVEEEKRILRQDFSAQWIEHSSSILLVHHIHV